jgi:AraC-like DNA-binding protein
MDQSDRICNILAQSPAGGHNDGRKAEERSLAPEGVAPNAIILLANYKASTPGWDWRFEWVGSRMLLWCLSGGGAVTVNGTEHAFTGGDFLFIPWGHSIRYRAAQEGPFFLGGIHVIPDHDPAVEPEYRIVHSRDSVPPDRPERRDVRLPGLEQVLTGSLDDVPGLEHLADYVVKWYVGRRRAEEVARSLGRVILSEMMAVARTPGAASVMLPARMRDMMDHVRANLHRRLTIADLEQVSASSAATVSRLFGRHLRMSPMTWIIRQRIEKAKELLSTTLLPVSEVGARVGVDDAFYFSKLFKKSAGQTATDYRRRNSLL